MALYKILSLKKGIGDSFEILKISSMSSLREKLKKMKYPVEVPTPAKSEIFICGFYGIIFIKVCCWFQMSIPIPKRNEFFEKNLPFIFISY